MQVTAITNSLLTLILCPLRESTVGQSILLRFGNIADGSD